jgi:hypothetical protein
MIDLDSLARGEGEAWAKERLEQFRQLRLSIPSRSPGHFVYAQMVAEHLCETGIIHPSDVAKLADKINEYAAEIWSLVASPSHEGPP